MTYKGHYVLTITEADVAGESGPRFGWRIRRVLSQVAPSDIGKQMWCHRGVDQIESDDERDERLRRGSGA